VTADSPVSDTVSGLRLSTLAAVMSSHGYMPRRKCCVHPTLPLRALSLAVGTGAVLSVAATHHRDGERPALSVCIRVS